MARREVIEVVCDRCKRVETQAPNAVVKPEGEKNEFYLQFHGKITSYEDLCSGCRKALRNYLDRMLFEPKSKETKSVAETPEKKGSFFSRSKATG